MRLGELPSLSRGVDGWSVHEVVKYYEVLWFLFCVVGRLAHLSPNSASSIKVTVLPVELR